MTAAVISRTPGSELVTSLVWVNEQYEDLKRRTANEAEERRGHTLTRAGQSRSAAVLRTGGGWFFFEGERSLRGRQLTVPERSQMRSL